MNTASSITHSRSPRALAEPQQSINEPFDTFQRRHYTWRTQIPDPFADQIPENEGKPPSRTWWQLFSEIAVSVIFGGPMAEYETEAVRLPTTVVRVPENLPSIRGDDVIEMRPMPPTSPLTEVEGSDLQNFATRWYSGDAAEVSEMGRVTELLNESNVGNLPAVEDYIEAGSSFINNDLRYGDGQNFHTREFVKEFGDLEKYEGPSYRAATVSPETRLALKNGVDKVFFDPGVQSASIVEQNARGWFRDWASSKQTSGANEPLVFIFDDTVTQKNLASSFLSDHVAVPPGEHLVVMDTEERGGVLFVHFGGVKEYGGTPIRIETGGPEQVQ